MNRKEKWEIVSEISEKASDLVSILKINLGIIRKK